MCDNTNSRLVILTSTGEEAFMAKIGFIYVIRNDEHVSDRFKVGQTYDVEKRLRELNSETSNVGEFKLVAKFPVEDAEVAERKCHKALEEFKLALDLLPYIPQLQKSLLAFPSSQLVCYVD